MKKVVVTVKGDQEEAVGFDILQGIYAALQNHDYTDVSICAETVKDRGLAELQVPDFLQSFVKERR